MKTDDDTNDAQLCSEAAHSRGLARTPRVGVDVQKQAVLRRDALARTFSVRLLLCNEDELRVLDVILGRLELGRDRYGHLDLAKSRDWDAEEAEELLDARIYRACDVIQKRDARLERLRCEAADEIAGRIEPGLRELASNAPAQAQDWPGPFDLGDLGGES